MGQISIRGLTKVFDTEPVLRGIDLDIAEGELVVLLGPSGCGKSTLLRLLAGLETATSGEIRINGRDVAGLEPKDRGCAMVFQNYALYPHMTVAENIGYGLRVAGVARAERRARVEAIARLVELDGLLDRKPGHLSGGQRQRVAMARAVIRSPAVFLFDEPLSNLDAKLRVQMRHEIRRVHRQVGATSLFVTHDQVEGMTLADRLVVMNRGIVEQIGAPAEIYDRPASLFVAGFIGSPAMNFLPATITEDGRRARLADGIVLELARGGLPTSRRVVLGLRPEDLRFASPVGAALDGRFEFMEDLGGGRLYHLTVCGEPVGVLSAERRGLAAGDAISVAVDPRAVHVFDAESGRRIEAEAARRAA